MAVKKENTKGVSKKIVEIILKEKELNIRIG